MRAGSGIRIVCILVLSVFLRLHYALTAPIGSAFQNGLRGNDDEASHLNYARALAETGRFPIQHDSIKSPGARARNEYEYYQPPLYYLIAALVLRVATALQPGMELLALRGLSLLLGVGQVLLTWPVLRSAFPDRRVAEAGLLIAAFLGSQIKATTCVSNDSLVHFLFAIGLLLLLRLERRRDLRSEVYLAGVLALTWLTKTSASVLSLLVLAAYARRAVADRDPGRFVRGALLVLVSFLVSLPWYLRNLELYDEFFAISVGHGPRFDYPMALPFILRRFAHVPYEILFGWYLEYPNRLFKLLTAFEYAYLLAAATALLLVGFRVMRSPLRAPAAPLALALLALYLAAYFPYALSYGFFGPGHVLGALSGIAIVLALPLTIVQTEKRPAVTSLILAGLLVLPKHIYHLVQHFTGWR